jgi:Ankyrin repeats (3 copies)/SEFIR domain
MKLIDAFIVANLEIVLQQSRNALSLIGVIDKDSRMVSAHRIFVEEFEVKIITYLGGRLLQIKRCLSCLQTDPESRSSKIGLQTIHDEMAESLEANLSNLTHTNLDPPLEVFHIAILTQMKEDLKRGFIDLKVDERGFYVSLLNDKILGQSLEKINNARGDSHAPTCFISYSWGNPTHVSRVHNIAFALRDAGIDILLDIERNKTSHVSSFIEYIDNESKIDGHPMKANFVLVMCAEDVNEKWNNFVSDGKSRQEYDPGLQYRGHVLPTELNRISRRCQKEPIIQQTVFPILLSGTYESSVPNFLPETTTELEQTDLTQYGSQLLKLLKVLYKNNEKVLAEINKQEAYYLQQRQINADLALEEVSQKYEELCSNSGSSSRNQPTASSSNAQASTHNSDELPAANTEVQADQHSQNNQSSPIACSSTAVTNEMMLHQAMQANDYNKITSLLLQGVDDNIGYTEMHLAVLQGYTEVVEYLLTHNKDLLNTADAIGNTALAYAASGGHLRMIQCLCAAGAKVGLASQGEVTFLHNLLRQDYTDQSAVSETLDALLDTLGPLQLNQMILTQDEAGNNPLHIALQHQADLQNILLQHISSLKNATQCFKQRNQAGQTTASTHAGAWL